MEHYESRLQASEIEELSRDLDALRLADRAGDLSLIREALSTLVASSNRIATEMRRRSGDDPDV